MGLILCPKPHKLSKEESITLDPSVLNLILLVELCRRSCPTPGKVPLGPPAPLGPLRPPAQRWFHEFVCIPNGSNAPALVLLLHCPSVLFVNDKWSDPKTFPATARTQSFFSLPHRSHYFVPTGSEAPNTNTNTNKNTMTNTNTMTNVHTPFHASLQPLFGFRRKASRLSVCHN